MSAEEIVRRELAEKIANKVLLAAENYEWLNNLDESVILEIAEMLKPAPDSILITREQLASIQWSGKSSDCYYCAGQCPVCGNHQDDDNGHATGCWLGINLMAGRG